MPPPRYRYPYMDPERRPPHGTPGPTYFRTFAIASPDRTRNNALCRALSAGSMECVQEENELMVRKLMTMALVAGMVTVAACNTVSGAGKDVSSAGRAVSKTADGAH